MNSHMIRRPLLGMAFVLTVTAGGIARAGWLEAVTPAVAAPPLSLSDTGGVVRSLGELSGKVVLVNFWATWCTPCLEEIPSIKRLRKRAGSGLVVLGVNGDEPRGRVRQFVKRLAIDFPVLLDFEGDAFRAWKIKAYPSSFLVDGAGRLRFKAIGPIEWDSEEATAAVERLLNEAGARER